MKQLSGPHLKRGEKIAAVLVLLGSFLTLAYTAGESWFG